MAQAKVPSWLEAIPRSRSEGPRLYAWTAANLPGSQASVGHDNAELQAQAWRHTADGIIILGVGNLGRLYAACLSKLPDAPPISLVVHRRELLEHWARKPGIEITRGGHVEKTVDYELAWWTPEKPAFGPIREVGTISNLIVATKAPDAIPQADWLRRYLGRDSTVAFVQNGMNRLWPLYGAEYNDRRYDAREHPNWLACVTTHGVTSLGPFRSVHASPADIAMSAVMLNPRSGSKADFLMGRIAEAPHLNARRVSRATLWVLQLEKLVVNSIINPLTAILRCKNGALFSNPGGEIERVIDLLLDEASHLLRALVLDDCSIEVLSETGTDSATEWIGWDEAPLEEKRRILSERFKSFRLQEMLFRVGEKVAENTSSMLQDVQMGKKTEIWEFNGWLLDTAAYLGGLEMTNHTKLCELVEKGVVLDASSLGNMFFGAAR